MYLITEWVSHVRKEGNKVKIVPRLLLEGWTLTDFKEVFASEASMKEVADFVLKSLKVWERHCFKDRIYKLLIGSPHLRNVDFQSRSYHNVCW